MKPIELAKSIVMGFDLEELKTLCFQVGVPFDDLRGEGLEGKARELVEFCDRRNMLDALAVVCYDLRPTLFWDQTVEDNVSTPRLRHMIPMLTSGTKRLVGIQMARFERQQNDLATASRRLAIGVGVATTLAGVNMLFTFILILRGLF
jgi:hypothetical protein